MSLSRVAAQLPRHIRVRRPELRRYPLYRLADEARGLENIQNMRVIARQNRVPRFPGSPCAGSSSSFARWRAAIRDLPCARQCPKVRLPSRHGSADSSPRPVQTSPEGPNRYPAGNHRAAQIRKRGVRRSSSGGRTWSAGMGISVRMAFFFQQFATGSG